MSQTTLFSTIWHIAAITATTTLTHHDINRCVWSSVAVTAMWVQVLVGQHGVY